MDQKSKVFHSCFTKNRDGANCLIGCGEKCLTRTDQPFWKFPEDVSSGVRTRSQEKEHKRVTKRQFEKDFRQKDIQRWVNSYKDGSINSDLELEVDILQDN